MQKIIDIKWNFVKCELTLYTVFNVKKMMVEVSNTYVRAKKSI